MAATAKELQSIINSFCWRFIRGVYDIVFVVNLFMSCLCIHYHSTETALLGILNDIYGEASEGRSILLIALDLSAAFDTVEHSVLFSCLENSFGVCSQVLQWVRLCLTMFTICFIWIGYRQHHRLPMWCTTGISSWFPTVCCMRCSVARMTSEFCTAYHQYADDTQRYISLSKLDYNSTVINLQNCLSAVHTWFSQNGLVINPDKSEAVHFSSPQHSKQHHHQLHCRWWMLPVPS